ncbi:unnamed protein product [Caenorhabditis angaria]|uniref:NR LBD domain-containing protein n=1 Tax=Caenorhabditis angaria TaxID=860376 RepID=A0A9P1IT48_9PELO|nr:unnamed protein product [Caenorhabditis angaria]
MLKVLFILLIINIQFLANAHISGYNAISGSENCQKIFNGILSPNNLNLTKKVDEMYNFLYQEYVDLRNSEFSDQEILIFMNWFCQVFGYLTDFDRTKVIPLDGIIYGNTTWMYQYSPAFIKSVELHKKYLKEYQKRKFHRKHELELAYVEKMENKIFDKRILPRTLMIYNILLLFRVLKYFLDYFYEPTIRLTNFDFLMTFGIFINISILNYMLYY